MKHFILLLLVFFSMNCLCLRAQTDTLIVYLDKDDKPCSASQASKYAVQHKDKDHWKKVVFDVADDKPVYGAYYSDAACTQFEGPYTAFHKNNKIRETGRYDRNKKAGIWRGFSDEGKLNDSAFYKDGFISGLALTWYPDGTTQDSLIFTDNGNGTCRSHWRDGKPKQSGDFVAGKKSGMWTYHHTNGMKCQEVKYEADSALSYTCYDEKGNIQTEDCIYEKEASYKGGDRSWSLYLGSRLSKAALPNAYYEGKIYGTIYILFVVDVDGKVTDVKTLNSIDPVLDEMARKIVGQSPRWEPAVQYNRKVKAYRKQPITFPKAQ